MGKSRPHSHTLVSATAACEGCAWNITAANAQALAAQHFDNKGHRVKVHLVNEITYGRCSGKTGKGEKQEGLFR